ncbi:hypothetical protein ABB37_09071 [Leptomonas pyrrhocoris]|uniref:EF-hand domain-containing protein n=1 Tax=Leptomonas pyrrhocoris TaxID=157538 RepID=A0A0M9FRV4_LEPPY|nr:hypothetical protein ABB37_09071 [Leptomonas pyrrhocoris]KPA74790.1 hypothetical protein ABB37_09071 [Leptomonas pyrrhocoris]|eukprot:XP_015653229.1 hypothetical protein ABB37_09071 [Leptomonas pyrrhocoris]
MLGCAVSDLGVVLSVRIDGHVSDAALLRGVSVDRTAMEAYESKPEVKPSDAMGGAKLDDAAAAAAATAGINGASISAVLLPSPNSEDEAMGLSSFYACTPADVRVRQRVFHYLNILPFGLQRASDIFSVVGRHTNVGLVIGVTDDNQYRVMPYPNEKPLQLERVRTAPQLSHRRDTPVTAEVDPACLQRIHRESHGHRAHQNMTRFFRRTGARFGAAVRESSLISADTTTVFASVLGSASSPSSRLLPTVMMNVAGTTASGVGPSLRAPRRSNRVAPIRLAPSTATTPLASPPVYTPTSFRGSVAIQPRSSAAEHVTSVLSAAASAASMSRQKRASCDEGSAGASGATVSGTGKQEDLPEVLYLLRDLQLPPPLALHGPVPPHRVGTRVVARRFGCADVLHMGIVLAADYDVSYTIRYDCDGEVDVGVLHCDIHALDDVEDDGNAGRGRRQTRERIAEPCRVRDRVVVDVAQRARRAVVMAAAGSGRYHLALVAAPVPLIEVESRQIQSVEPILFGAIFAQPRYLALFRRLDSTGSGRVSWKDVRHFVLSSEGFGQPLSFQRLGELQRDMRIRKHTVEPQLLSKVPVQEEEQQLSFRDFEYVLMRVENLL